MTLPLAYGYTGGPLTVSGALTVTGAFTSLGIDDNATSEALQLSGGAGTELVEAVRNLSAGGTITVGALLANPMVFTGAAGGVNPNIQALGSDSNIGLEYYTKASGSHQFFTSSGARQFQIGATAGATNYLQVTGANAASPALSALGTSTNIDITITPKGTGVLRYGVFAANAGVAVSGTFPMKMADGTTKHVMVSDAA